MGYFITDIKKIYSNKFIRIMVVGLFILAVLDPAIAWYYESTVGEGIAEHPYVFWMLNNSSVTPGFTIFRRFLYIFPIISTGLIYFEERKNSLCGILLTKGSKRKYFCSKVISVFLTTFINFLIPLLLNVLVTYMLFDSNAPATETFTAAIPKPGMFCEPLFLKSPVYVCILYCVLNAFSEALLAVFVLFIHMIYKFSNRYIAFIVPFIISYSSLYITYRVFGPKYDFPLIIQPTVVSAWAGIKITTFNVIITYGVFIAVLGMMTLIASRGNKDIL